MTCPFTSWVALKRKKAQGHEDSEHVFPAPFEVPVLRCRETPSCCYHIQLVGCHLWLWRCSFRGIPDGFSAVSDMIFLKFFSKKTVIFFFRSRENSSKEGCFASGLQSSAAKALRQRAICSLAVRFSQKIAGQGGQEHNALSQGFREWDAQQHKLGGEVFQSTWQWSLCKESISRRRACGICSQRPADEH